MQSESCVGLTMDKCRKALEKAGLVPTEALCVYMERVLYWNAKINVTGAASPDELAIKHIADTHLALSSMYRNASTVVDVGSGGGIPGLVISLLLPAVQVKLVERRQKKASVLAALVQDLRLESRVSVHACGFEALESWPKSADYWFRGFMPGPKLAVYLSATFPKAELGRLVLMKGPGWAREKEELLAMRQVKHAWRERFNAAQEVSYELPFQAGHRCLVLV